MNINNNAHGNCNSNDESPDVPAAASAPSLRQNLSSDEPIVKQEPSDNWVKGVKEEPADMEEALFGEFESCPVEVDEH